MALITPLLEALMSLAVVVGACFAALAVMRVIYR